MLNNNSSSLNSHMNSFIFKFDRLEDEFNIMEEKTPNNMSMFISSSYISSEIQEIHDGSNMKENEISEQFNNTNILGKKEALDKSMNFQNMNVEEEFIHKDDVTNLGRDTGIEPIKEREDDDEVNESFYHGDVNFIDEFEKRENLFNEINNNFNINHNNININNNVNNTVIYECSGNNLGILDDMDKLKIRTNLVCLKLSKNNSYFNLTNSGMKDISNSNNNNKSALNDNKKLLFNVTKQPDDYITANIKLNMSSCQLSCKSKKNKRGRKQILLSGIKTEIMDKTFLREFKKYLKLKKKEYQNIFDQDYVFWNEFLESKNPPFSFTQGGKKIPFRSYNRKLMNFIFSRKGANTLYTKFISENRELKVDRIFSKKHLKKGPDYYTIAFYKYYRENLNRLYSKEYSEMEIDVDDLNINNISMDFVSNSFK